MGKRAFRNSLISLRYLIVRSLTIATIAVAKARSQPAERQPSTRNTQGQVLRGNQNLRFRSYLPIQT